MGMTRGWCLRQGRAQINPSGKENLVRGEEKNYSCSSIQQSTLSSQIKLQKFLQCQSFQYCFQGKEPEKNTSLKDDVLKDGPEGGAKTRGKVFEVRRFGVGMTSSPLPRCMGFGVRRIPRDLSATGRPTPFPGSTSLPATQSSPDHRPTGCCSPSAGVQCHRLSLSRSRSLRKAGERCAFFGFIKERWGCFGKGEAHTQSQKAEVAQIPKTSRKGM